MSGKAIIREKMPLLFADTNGHVYVWREIDSGKVSECAIDNRHTKLTVIERCNIVRAVNHHDKLVALLERINAALPHTNMSTGIGDDIRALLKEIKS